MLATHDFPLDLLQKWRWLDHGLFDRVTAHLLFLVHELPLVEDALQVEVDVFSVVVGLAANFRSYRFWMLAFDWLFNGFNLNLHWEVIIVIDHDWSDVHPDVTDVDFLVLNSVESEEMVKERDRPRSDWRILIAV